MAVGQRLAVGGNAYFTEVNGFSGQSGQVEFCTPAANGARPDKWDRHVGIASPPTKPATTVALPTTKAFGESDLPCAPTVLTNGDDDRQILAAGVACFLTEYEAARSVIWDVSIPTVEGDPIVCRYDSNGTTTIITTDYCTFDNLGGGGVT